MMLIPRRNDFDLWDDIFDDPFFTRHENKVMKTDIKEHENCYDLSVDLPGFEKENIKIDLQDGYLTINAKMDQENSDEEKGTFIRRERYYGECSRSFFVGEDINEEDINASFKNGILKVIIPKKNLEEVKKEKKYINID